MNKILMTGIYFFISRLLQGTGSQQGSTENLTKLKLAAVYLQAVKASRLLVIGLVGSGACLLLFVTGLMLIHQIILFYSPWSIAVKVTVTLVCAASYIFIAVGVFLNFFAEDKWLKIFNAEALIRELTETQSSRLPL